MIDINLIREKFGVRIALLIFTLICIANLGNIITDVAALKVAGEMLGVS